MAEPATPPAVLAALPTVSPRVEVIFWPVPVMPEVVSFAASILVSWGFGGGWFGVIELMVLCLKNKGLGMDMELGLWEKVVEDEGSKYAKRNV